MHLTYLTNRWIQLTAISFLMLGSLQANFVVQRTSQGPTAIKGYISQGLVNKGVTHLNLDYQFGFRPALYDSDGNVYAGLSFASDRHDSMLSGIHGLTDYLNLFLQFQVLWTNVDFAYPGYQPVVSSGVVSGDSTMGLSYKAMPYLILDLAFQFPTGNFYLNRAAPNVSYGEPAVLLRQRTHISFWRMVLAEKIELKRYWPGFSTVLTDENGFHYLKKIADQMTVGVDMHFKLFHNAQIELDATWGGVYKMGFSGAIKAPGSLTAVSIVPGLAAPYDQALADQRSAFINNIGVDCYLGDNIKIFAQYSWPVMQKNTLSVTQGSGVVAEKVVAFLALDTQIVEYQRVKSGLAVSF